MTSAVLQLHHVPQQGEHCKHFCKPLQTKSCVVRFARQSFVSCHMESPCIPKFQGHPGNRLTILTIDGGGVRGLIPAKVIELLEKLLQDIDGPDVRISDYFDVIGGTSTGALIAAMLTCPDEHRQPLYRASEAPGFYMENAPTIFPQTSNVIRSIQRLLQRLTGPKYSAENLEKILAEKFGNVKLGEAVTELLIPAYDIKNMQPAVFSTSAAKDDCLSDVYFRDVCRGTSAAPTYFPPHFFEIRDPKSKRSREYNLIDGGMAANNPTYLSIVHILQQKFVISSSFRDRIRRGEFGNLLVLSLGTGSRPESYLAQNVSRWGALSWVWKDGSVPLLDISMNASADMVEFFLSALFQTVESFDNYLRIQVVNLSSDLEGLDNASTSNLQRLSERAEQLLDETVTTVDPQTGRYIPQPERGTNREALEVFAKALANERKSRPIDKEKGLGLRPNEPVVQMKNNYK